MNNSYCLAITILLKCVSVSTLSNLLYSDMCRPPESHNVHPLCSFRGGPKTYCVGDGIIRPSWEDDIPEDKRLIVCSAPYPIEVHAKFHPRLILGSYVEHHRFVTDVFDRSTYMYYIRIPQHWFYTDDLFAWKSLVVRSVQNSSLTTAFISILRSKRSLEVRERKEPESIIVVREETVNIPCTTWNGTYPEGIYKSTRLNGSVYISVDNEGLTWDPLNGFTFNILTLENMGFEYEGKYLCKSYSVMNRKNLLERNITLERVTGVIVEPNNPDLTVFTISPKDVIVKCSSDERITFNVDMNRLIRTTNTSIEFGKGGTEAMKTFTVVLSLKKLTPTDHGRISCVTMSDRRPLFVWDLNVLNVTNVTDEYEMYMDLDRGEARCYSPKKVGRDINTETGKSSFRLKNIGCKNPVECSFASQCTNDERTDCFGIVVRNGDSCGYSNCQLIKPFHHGILTCTTPHTTYSVMYFTGFDTNCYTDWREAPEDALIRMVIPEENRLYSDSSFVFSCQGHQVYASGPAVWVLEFKNNTQIHVGNLNQTFQPKQRGVVTARTIHVFAESEVRDGKFHSNSIYLSSADITKVICMMPVLSSYDWVNISRHVNVKQSIFPYVISKNTTVAFRMGSRNNNLLCEVESYPPANVTWEMNANNSSQNFTVVQSENAATLNFPEFTAELAGEYTCTATSVLGMATQTFRVKIAEIQDVGFSYLWLYLLVSIILLTVISSVFGFVWTRHKLQRAKEGAIEEAIQRFLNGSGKEGPDEFPYDENFEIEKEKLQIRETEILGSGAFGIVYRANLEDYPEAVAVKCLHQNQLRRDSEYFNSILSELKLLIFVGKHPNIVELIGACTRDIRRGEFIIVTEECTTDLEHFLRTKNRQLCPSPDYTDLNDPVHLIEEEQEIQMRLLEWSYQIADAMEFISGKNVIHGDLATRNVLLSRDGVAKLTDFGLAMNLYNYAERQKEKKGLSPWRWMAIETLREMKFSIKSDVWSYGVLLWELYSLGAVPYGGMEWDSGFVEKLRNGLKLLKPERADEGIYALMLDCWNINQCGRPEFSSLKQFFQDYQRQAQYGGPLEELYAIPV